LFAISSEDEELERKKQTRSARTLVINRSFVMIFELGDETAILFKFRNIFPQVLLWANYVAIVGGFNKFTIRKIIWW
jgi:hypothetical protein